MGSLFVQQTCFWVMTVLLSWGRWPVHGVWWCSPLALDELWCWQSYLTGSLSKSSECWNPLHCLVAMSSIRSTVMRWTKALTFRVDMSRGLKQRERPAWICPLDGLLCPQHQKQNPEKVETLARKISGEMLWYYRRGESVTRAVGMRMGCGGEGGRREIYIKKTQKCLPECGGAEGAWTRCP